MEKKSTDGISAHTAVAPDEVDPNNAGRHSASRFREHEDPGNLAAKEEKSPVVHHEDHATSAERGARELGLEPGSERRKKLERRLKLKLDLRFSIFVVIYSMSIEFSGKSALTPSLVSWSLRVGINELMEGTTLTVTMQRPRGESPPRPLVRTVQCLIDRLQGFEEDLHLKGTEFQTLLSILYVGYILFQGEKSPS
jgi:hypothetical protein